MTEFFTKILFISFIFTRIFNSCHRLRRQEWGWTVYNVRKSEFAIENTTLVNFQDPITATNHPQKFTIFARPTRGISFQIAVA